MGRREARAAVADNKELWDLQLMEGQLDLIAAEWALRHGGPADYFLTRFGRRLAVAEELNPTALGVYLERARSALLRARWEMDNDGDPAEVIASGILAADRGLEIDRTDAEFFLVKGRLLLIEARSAGDAPSRNEAADRAVQALEAAESFNPLYEKTCKPLIAEARSLQDQMVG